MEESIVKVNHLFHRYSVQWAVKDVSLEITKNGIYGLLGSNGAGKSTTMNIMCGVLKQTSGEVFIQGYDTRKHPVEAKRCLGFLPQKAPLHLDLSVEEFLTYSANMRDVPPKQVGKAIDRVLEKCNITHFRHRLLRNLSGGYQQRVGIAQAIIHDPSFVVLDEPANGLDPNQILEVRHLIKDIAEECTVVLSTHILPEVQAVCDYIFMIEEGQLIFSGTVGEFDNYIVPNTIYVALRAVPDVSEVKEVEGVLDVEHLGGIEYRVKYNESVDVVDGLVEASVRNEWHLAEIRQEKSSLDSIFAALSKSVKK